MNNRQTDRQDERSDICVKAGLNDSNQFYQMNCIACVVHSGIYVKSADRQDKALVSSSTDESEQFGNKYSMHKLDMESHNSCISRTNG